MSEKKEKYSFKGFEIDPALRELRAHGELVEIEPKAFDLLIYLIKERDRVVDKDELLAQVWPSMVITETALTRAVMKVRKAVNDDASQQSVIKTVHGHGYRFVAAIEESSSVLAQAADSRRISSSHSLRNVVIGLSITALIAIGWWSVRKPEVIPEQMKLAVLPLVEHSGDPEYSWTELGLMSYVSRAMGDETKVEVVADGNVVGLAENFSWNGDLSDPANAQLIEKLSTVYGANHFLAMNLHPEINAWRMNYALAAPNGSIQQGTMVGDEGTQLAAGVVQATFDLLLRRQRQTTDTPLISRDPFNNEAFARGISLSLKGRCAEAIQYFELIVDQEPTLFAPRFELASCLRLQGENEPAEAMLVQLAKEQEMLGTTMELARTRLMLGVLYNRTGRIDLARTEYEATLDLARQLGDSDFEGRVLHNYSILYEDLNQLDEAEQMLNRAVVAYKNSGREVMPGQLWSAKANIKMDRGDLDGADVELQKALDAFRDIGDRRNEAMMLNNRGYLRRRQGRIDEAESYHLHSLEIRQEINDVVGQGRIWSMLGGVYTAQGRYQEAEQAALKAVEIARDTQDRLFEGTSLATLADAEQSLGKNEMALTHYRESREVLAQIQDLRRTLQVDLRLAQLQFEAGDTDAAYANSEQVLEQARASDLNNTEVQALEKLGDFDYSSGELESAITRWEEALVILSGTSWQSKINAVSSKLSNAFMDAQKLEQAAPLIGRLAVDEPNVSSLKVQARYSYLTQDSHRAVSLMEQAKKLAGAHWSEQSETDLQAYLAGGDRK